MWQFLCINTLTTYCPITSINIYNRSKYKHVPDLIPNAMPLLGTADSGMGRSLSLPERPWEEIKYIPRDTTYHKTVGHFNPLYAGGQRTTLQAQLGCLS